MNRKGLFNQRFAALTAAHIFFSFNLIGAAAALEPPANVAWESSSETRVDITWANVDEEVYVEFQVLNLETNEWVDLSTSSGPGTVTKDFVIGVANDPVTFRMRSVTKTAEDTIIDQSNYTAPFVVVTRDDLGIVGRKCEVQLPGAFRYEFTVEGFAFDQLIAEGLPASLALLDQPLRLEGEIAEGSHALKIVGRNGKHTRSLALSIEAPTLLAPVVTQPVSANPLDADAANLIIDLNTAFSDPDTETIVRMTTSVGNIDIALADSSAPLTVANFLDYTDQKAWDGSFFHKSIGSAVIQGGRFALAEEAGKIRSITENTPVADEYDPARPNSCGTIAMTKVTDSPDSATNQWFFNAADNADLLDIGTEGPPTTFGRVMGNGMDIVSAIANLPTGDFSVQVITCTGTPPNETCNEQSAPFRNWPLLRLREQGLDTDDLVFVTSVDRIRPLRFSLIENSTPTVTTATVSDAGELTIDYLAPGTSTITIAATDLDGLSVLHTFEIEVTNSFSFWASAMGLEGNAGDLQANPDGDAFDNFLEYAFGGTPTVDDSGAIATSAIQSPGNDNVLIPSISFFYRQNAGDLSYAVQTTNDLTKDWTPLWTSADGLGSPAVIKATPSRGLTKVTVGAKGIPLPAYLRIQVSAE